MIATQPSNEVIEERRFRALLHENFFAFVMYAFGQFHGGQQASGCHGYLQAFCYLLQHGEDDPGRRLIFAMPPRALKSFILICYSAWRLGRDPGLKIYTVSYSDILARDLTNRFRSVVCSDWYQALFPHMQIETGQDREGFIGTTAGGYRRSTTVEGANTGLGGDIIIADDLSKAADVNSPIKRQKLRRFLNDTLFTRLNNPAQSTFIAAMQRLHTDDIVSSLMEMPDAQYYAFPAKAVQDEVFELYNGDSWTRRVGDLLDEERLGEDVLKDIQDRSPHVYAAQYQQQPEYEGASMIDMRKVRFVTEAPPRDDLLYVAQFWDIATGDRPHNDYSVGLTAGWHDEVWYILDVLRGRFTFPVLRAHFLSYAFRWRADRIVVERSSSGPALVDQMRSEGRYNVVLETVTESKSARFYPYTAFLQSNKVAVLQDKRWTRLWCEECEQFPDGRHDDQVDATSMFAKFANTGFARIAIDEKLNGGRRSARTIRVHNRPRDGVDDYYSDPRLWEG